VSTLVILGAIAAAAAALYVAIEEGKRRRRRRDTGTAEMPFSAKAVAAADGLAARFVTSGRTFQHCFITE
jgi:gas vesicle protein